MNAEAITRQNFPGVANGLRRTVLALLLGLILCLPAFPRPPSPPPDRSVYHARLRTTVNPVTADYLSRAIKKTKADGARALLIELDTPGGLMASMERITRAILNAEVPVLVWIGPDGGRAGSAGVFITYAAHVAAMAPGTTIGAAHPVKGGGGDLKGEIKKKVLNDAVARIRSMADRHGRNAELAEAFVRESKVIDAAEAVQKNVVNRMADAPHKLIDQLAGQNIRISDEKTVSLSGSEVLVPLEMTWQEEFLNTLVNPNLVYFLVILGVLGLVTEFANPGFGGGLLVGGFCLLFALYGMSVLPVDFTGLLLLLAGLGLMISDVFIPSFGLLTVGGLVSFFLGSTMLFKSTPFTLSPPVIAVSCGTSLVVVLLIGYFIVRGQFAQVQIGDGLLVGKEGRVRDALDPDGMVHVHGEYWSARAAGDELIPEGTTVRVVQEEDTLVLVEPVHSTSSSSGGTS